ncbi:hypothetical protein ABTE00_22205, partial [Acinetobacter baumannii]
YSPSQLVQDARRHRVNSLPPDVTVSGWESVLENDAVRLGLNRVKGMREAAALRIERARLERPFASVEDLVLRAGLDRHD